MSQSKLNLRSFPYQWCELNISYFENLSGKVFPPSFIWRRFPQPATIFKFLPTDATRQNAIKNTSSANNRYVIEENSAEPTGLRQLCSAEQPDARWVEGGSRSASTTWRFSGGHNTAFTHQRSNWIGLSGVIAWPVLAAACRPCLLSGDSAWVTGEAKASDVLFMRSCQILQGNRGDVDGEGSRRCCTPEVRKWKHTDELNQQAEAEPSGSTGANVLEKCGWGAWL